MSATSFACSLPSQGEKTLDGNKYIVVDIADLRRCNNFHNLITGNHFDDWMRGHKIFFVAIIPSYDDSSRSISLEEGGNIVAWGRASAPPLKMKNDKLIYNHINKIKDCNSFRCEVEIFATLEKRDSGTWYIEFNKGQFNGNMYGIGGEIFRGWIGTMENMLTFWSPF